MNSPSDKALRDSQVSATQNLTKNRDELAEAFVKNYVTMNNRPPHRPDVLKHCFECGFDARDAEMALLQAAARPAINERLIAMTKERDELLADFAALFARQCATAARAQRLVGFSGNSDQRCENCMKNGVFDMTTPSDKALRDELLENDWLNPDIQPQDPVGLPTFRIIWGAGYDARDAEIERLKRERHSIDCPHCKQPFWFAHTHDVSNNKLSVACSHLEALAAMTKERDELHVAFAKADLLLAAAKKEREELPAAPLAEQLFKVQRTLAAERARSQRLLEVLRYYAHPEHYKGRETMTGLRQPGVLTEGGDKAREAIAGYEAGEDLNKTT